MGNDRVRVSTLFISEDGKAIVASKEKYSKVNFMHDQEAMMYQESKQHLGIILRHLHRFSSVIGNTCLPEPVT